ncbi:MAG TPA: nitrous oxide-stimulated promoter family protein [Dehalococcoidia bacterium]|nr:nitrous oxide-stimulated promoter family protein [Dehalococcoidia bacterium]
MVFIRIMAENQGRRNKRIERERKTLITMIGMYCKGNHQGENLCPECAELLDYALKRLENCSFGEGKTTCAKCPVHCYKPQMRERIRKVMRYAGPRMIYTHPIQAIYHILDGRRKAPLKRQKGSLNN